MTVEYSFPDGTVLTSGVAIFGHILATKQDATATENARGWHVGRTIQYEVVADDVQRHRERKVSK